MTQNRRKANPSAADLLGNWRATERDTAAAKKTEEVARLAAFSATETEAAGTDENAARAAMEAAPKAKESAAKAKRAHRWWLRKDPRNASRG